MANDAPSEDTPEAARRSPFKSRKVRLALLVAVVAVLIAGGWWFLNYQTTGKYLQSTDNAYIEADAVTVAPKVGGYVDRVLVGENQDVRLGQPLVQLDVRDYRAQQSQAQAQIGATLASADTIRAQIQEQQAAVSQARAQLEAARAEAALAAQEARRYEPLAATGAEPRERLDQLQAQARQARARVDAAEAGLAAAQRRISTLGRQVEQALSQAEASRAQLESTRLNVESTLLRASIAGRVGDLTVRAGQFVQPGTRLMSLVPVDQLFIEANFKETQVGLMRVGQPVRIEIDALPDLELTGRVASIAPGTGAEFSILPPENATGNFTKIVQRIPVRIAISASPEVRRLLVPGMSVEVTVDTRSAKGELERLREAGRD
ncbi:HlyD family secretion protein [Altererythrobacter lauratis]|jgi:membrane fusion protein (multidrug efflux system)|uniref:HlyD family secretion protein n=1 Tax=Alteraurantiacibacter lauratis TaxID=2054627 RepID=A0ABV7EEU0_9SPHN